MSIYEGHGVAPEVLQVYKAAWDAGELTVRSHLVLSPTWRSLQEAQRDMATWAHSASGFGFGDDMLRICGVFIQLRGSRHLARLRSAELPFTNWAGFAESYNPAPRYQRLIRIAAQYNLRVHSLAATADEVEDVLQAFEAVQAEQPIADRRWVLEHVRDVQQNPRNSRRNVLPVELINWPLWMGHEYLAGSLGELMQIAQTPSRADGLLHGAPESFHGIEMLAAVGGESLKLKPSLVVLKRRRQLARPMHPPAIDNHDDVLPSFAKDLHHLLDIRTELLGIAMRHHLLEDP